ncbi:hypothetical protein D9M71_620030 [compost metagenome]
MRHDAAINGNANKLALFRGIAWNSFSQPLFYSHPPIGLMSFDGRAINLGWVNLDCHLRRLDLCSRSPADTEPRNP